MWISLLITGRGTKAATAANSHNSLWTALAYTAITGMVFYCISIPKNKQLGSLILISSKGSPIASYKILHSSYPINISRNSSCPFCSKFAKQKVSYTNWKIILTFTHRTDLCTPIPQWKESCCIHSSGSSRKLINLSAAHAHVMRTS